MYISPGLFHKAILQSGVAMLNWTIIENEPEATSYQLASALGNNSKDPEQVAAYLRTLPAADIVEAQYSMLTRQVIQLVLYLLVHSFLSYHQSISGSY